MRKIREVLRLTHEVRLSAREVGDATGLGKTAVAEYVRRAKVIGITWPVPDGVDDAELERRLFVPAGFHDGQTRKLPDWAKVHEELKKRAVTLMILWEEHRAECPDGHGYSQYCWHYGQWRKCLSPVMRQIHVGGDKLFVDWAGDTVRVIDTATGETRQAHLFIAALGASSYTYAEARWSESLPDWIGAHVNALDFIGGVPKALVPDNLKTGITSCRRRAGRTTPSRYEPGINRTYQELADHYDTVVLPARVRRPRDKAKVEAAVGLVERYIIGRLRNRRFLSLDELNIAVREAVATINAKVMKRIDKSRRALFESIDQPALKALPPSPYQYAEWKRCTVGPDYHVEVDDHYYSVPYRLLRETVDARVTITTIELFHKGKRVASHVRSAKKGKPTTLTDHMPVGHRRYAEWTPARMLSEAAKIGPSTVALVEAVMAAKRHPMQGLRACQGILDLAKAFAPERVEAAAVRGLAIGATTSASIRSILEKGLDRAVAVAPAGEAAPIRHENIRGRGTYH